MTDDLLNLIDLCPSDYRLARWSFAVAGVVTVLVGFAVVYGG